MMALRLQALALALTLAFVCAAPAAAQVVTPEELYDLYQKLVTPDVDKERYFDVAGQTLQREDLTLAFSEGVVHPVVRTDGKIVGLVFTGSGQVTFTPQLSREQQQLTHWLGETAYSKPFSTAFILATDDSVDTLLGDEGEWTTGDGAAPIKVKNAFDARWALYADPRWDDYGPSLEMDVLHDLYGDGYKGGYFYAEFDTEPTHWVTYYRNPRGALFRGEEITLFSHAGRGDAPQTMQVYSSYPSAEPSPYAGTGRPYDVAHVDLEVDVPKAAAGRDMSTMEFTAAVKVVALEGEVKAVALRLQNRKPRCKGDDPYGEFDIGTIRDYADQPLAAIHDHNQLFVVLNGPMQRNAIETLTINYEGELLESVTVVDQADTYFGALQDIPWYPRALWPDRHSLNTTVRVPKFFKGIATGALISEEEADGVRTLVFEEPGGVLGGMLAVGDYVITEGELGSIKIMVVTSMTNKQLAKDTLKRTQSMLRYFEVLWGPYPYSTLTMLDAPALPSGNWSYEATESGTMTQEAGWTCSPPGHLYPWQGFTTSDTACLSYHMPATAPATDGMEARNIDFYFVDNPEAQASFTAAQVARQWWNQFVGPASYRDRWISEAAVMLSAALYLGQSSGLQAQENREKTWHDMALRRDESGCLLIGDRLAQEFAGVIWGKGPAVLRMMLDELGGEPFINMMRSVMNRAPSGLVTNDLFASVAREYMGDGVEDFWTYWVEGTDIPGLRYTHEVTDADEGFTVSGELVIEGPVPPVAVPIRVKFSNREFTTEMVELTGERTAFSFTVEKKPKKVQVDPDHRVLLRYRKPLKE